MAYNDLIDRTAATDLIPVPVAREIVKNITETSAVLKLAKRHPDLTADTEKLPVVSTLPNAYWINGDTGMVQTTDVEWSNVMFYVEACGCIVPIPNRVLQDSQYDIWGEIRPLLEEAIGIAVDNTILWGTNKPTLFPTALKTTANSASNNVAIGTGADIYEDLLGESGIISKIEADGFMPNGYIAAPGMMAKLRGLRDANGQIIFLSSIQDPGAYQLMGRPIAFPETGIIAGTAGTAWMIAGDWTKLRYAIRQDISFSLSTEATLLDAAGNPTYSLWQQRMTAMMITFNMAWALPNPVNRLQPTAGSRCAFAFLTT